MADLLHFDAPLDVTLGERNAVQPDLLFFSSDRRDIMRKDRIDGPCTLVVEILSPSSRRKDRLKKMGICRKTGIPHYWLLDPEGKIMEAYQLQGRIISWSLRTGRKRSLPIRRFPD